MTTSKNKALAAMLAVSMAIMLAITAAPEATAASTVINVTAPAGTQDFTFSQRIRVDLARPYAGISFDLVVSDSSAITLNSYERDALSAPGVRDANHNAFLTPETRPDGRVGTYTFGFFTDRNIFSGNLDVGAINLTYSGQTSQSFTVTLRFAHMPGEGQPSAWMTDAGGRIFEHEITVNISRATTTTPTPIPTPTPTPGGNGTITPSPTPTPTPTPGGGGTTQPPSGGGGSIAVPPIVAEIEIEDEEAPLVSGRSFAAFIQGYPDNTFRGANSVSREEFVTIMFRIHNPGNRPQASAANPTFGDVAPGRWSYDAIEWAVGRGIVEVYASGNFRPRDALTRSEMAVMLVNAEGWEEVAQNGFSDIEAHPAREEILKAAAAGIFEGFPDGTFRPDATTTRNELVAAMVRYLFGGELPEAVWVDIVVGFADVQRGHWAFRYIALATTGYEASAP